MYYLYNADNERVEFPINGIKGACALLKNGVSICLKPQIKRENGAIQEIQGWIDLNGPKEPNIYGRDLRTFTIDLKNRAIYTNEATKVLLIKPKPICKGKDCGCVGDDCDPCKIDDRSEACCKQEGYVARAVDEANPDPDPCCPYFKNEAGANHDICFGPEPPCDPDTDPTCEDYCFHHTILGPDDECCAVLSAKGVANPNCCTNDSDSDYCCSIHPETEKCCKKRIDNGKLQLTADNVCCTKYQSIYNAYDVCKPACEVDNNSEKCCNSKERREKINNPDDQCCRFGGVNGLLDADAARNPYNQYCCRLPKNGSEQCCKWKYDHINSSLDFYTKHDYNQNKEVGSYDACCEGNVRGIRFTEGKSDAKSQAVLNRCCTLNQEKSNADEDRICCDYLVGQKGNSFLKHGQALRRCCKYNNHKNKPECCSHENDGMAFSADVSWAGQCCMPNSLYPNNVKPDLQCCFVNTSITNESNSFWQNRRWTDCCSYGGQTYNGHKANTEAQWQKNCCSLTRAQYPSDAAYNAACCVANATAKGISPSRDSWHYFSQTKNECCETLDNQYGESGRNENWTSNCCYGWKGGNFATKNPYYNQEAKCCMLDGNWTEACCTLAKIDKSSAKWNKNCCDNPTLYSKNSIYRENCCDTNATDYTRKNHGADTQTGLNGKNVDLSKHKEYCCHPNAVDPNVECCKLYSSSDDTWNDRDSNTISMDYQIKCCEKSPSAAVTYCPNSCHVRWETSKTINYDYSRCCTDRALQTNRGAVNRTTDVWKQNCCAYSPINSAQNNSAAGYASYADYRSGCCKPNTDQTFKDGNDGSGSQNNINCCIPDQTTVNISTGAISGVVPTKACCRAFKAYDTSDTGAWKNHDGGPISDAYKIACCKLYGECPSGPDSCKIRSNTWNSSRYNLPACCKDSTMQSQHYKDSDKEWRSNCCDGSITAGTSSLNTLGISEYRNYCCSNAGGSEATLKSGNEDYRCCANASESTRLASEKCCNAAKAAGYSNAFGARTFRDRCCQLSGNTGKTYCDCEEQYRLRFSDYFASSTACCADQKAKRGEANWNSVCCTSGNPASLSRDEFRNAGCCGNAKTGLAKVGGGYINHCCSGSSSDRVSDGNNFCCTKYSNYQCTCAYRLSNSMSLISPVNCCVETNGSYTNSHWKSQCCASTNLGSLNRDQFRTSCCTNGKNGAATGGGYINHCCSGSSSDRVSDGDNFCCTKYSNNQCTCTYRLNNSMSLTSPVNCCGETNGSYTNSHWKSQCCASSNPGGLSESSFRSACCNSNMQGGATGGGNNKWCCNNTLGNWSDYCCTQGNLNQCRCTDTQGNAYNGNQFPRCCSSQSTYCCLLYGRAKIPRLSAKRMFLELQCKQFSCRGNKMAKRLLCKFKSWWIEQIQFPISML